MTKYEIGDLIIYQDDFRAVRSFAVGYQWKDEYTIEVFVVNQDGVWSRGDEVILSTVLLTESTMKYWWNFEQPKL